ncbi:TIGR03086 family protein [Frankia sp. AgB1.9]|uniref:TIGR03086 family metal-binding protein n=1 Tax=unclassified Frankia TaxID=2632575 RepID=UPI00193425A4|nr:MULTISPECIES: TIGR03086 family metal-binding protein [unclassified Frankia]MBL7490867.1 TIGR03086 family protein [Frankia sp. AgW1.1]MBL7550919.1 TIGR03086 family protein [Frankia sp. AgB1.9]MBL7624428.1 TIGR03086 family protein [Frankia sp. AgB1.8]
MAEGRSTAADRREDTNRTGQPQDAGTGGSLAALADRPAERHRAVAAGFTDRVLGTKDWDAPTPVPEWTARDVVRHLCEWFPGFLAAGTGIELAQGPSVDEDPVAAWQVHADAVQALLDDPATTDRKLRHPMVGEHPLAPAVDQFYTVDIFMHTWDLARATGQDDSLDPDLCAVLLAGMEPIEGLLRDSGQYGPRVEVPAGSGAQTRLLAFIGRDPSFAPQA